MDEATITFMKEAGIIGVIASFIIACSGWLSEFVKGWWNRRKKALLLAASVLPVLDNFVRACAICVNDEGTNHGMGDQQGYVRPSEPLPTPPKYPENIDWLSINKSLMSDLLNLPSEAEIVNESMQFYDLEISTPPDYEESFEARWDHVSEIGLKAEKIAKSIRNQWNLPERNDDWNPVVALEEAQKKSAAKKEKIHAIYSEETL